MPSLASKPEPVVVSTDPIELLKLFVVAFEKRLRNLEKRKTRLEENKAKQRRGETLNEEQLQAVARLDDVSIRIEVIQEVIKQMTSSQIEIGKAQKKQQKKERFEQIESERRRFAELLHLQEVLKALMNEETRKAFAEGTNGAVKLDEQELAQLDQLHKIVNPECGADKGFVDMMRSSSENLQSLLDGRDKAVGETTYRQLHDLVEKIKNCPYFTAQPSKPEEQETVADNTDTSTEKEFVVVDTAEVPHADSEEVQASLPPEIPEEQEPLASSEVAFDALPTQAAPLQPQADPTKTFEEIVENVQGTFNFIQDSEIDVDSPSHVDPAVVSVHALPDHHYQGQPQPVVTQGYCGPHLIPMTLVIENSAYTQHPNEAVYQQYNLPSSATHPVPGYAPTDTPQPIPMPTEPTSSQNTSQSAYNSQAEPAEEPHHAKFGTNGGMTFESSVLRQPEKPHGEEFQQRGQGQGRRGGGGYRGRGNHNNGYSGRGGNGGYRHSGYRGGERDRPSGGDRDRSGNGFQPDNRRNNRGPRGGGFRGGSNNYSNNRRGGYRGGQHQQTANV